MKNKVESKKVISILLIALLLLLFTTKVYAANDSFNTTLQASSTQAKREENITITIGLKDIAIESGEKGIGAYTANIKFDSSVFEYVSTNATDNWEAPFYQNGLITGNTKSGEVVKTAQNIGTITFKVKKDAKLGDTTIELNNFAGSTAATDVSASNKTIKVTIADNGGNSNNEGNNNNTNNGNNNSSNNNNNINANKTTNTSNKTSKGDNTTVKQSTLPKTGTTDTIIFAVIGMSALIAATFFIKMIVLNRKMK